MSSSQKKTKKVTELINALLKNESKIQIQAIKDLKIHGNETAIEPLVKLYVESNNNVVKSEITDLLNTVKSNNVQGAVIDCLMNPDYESAYQMILSSIWNSNLDYSDYLNEIVETAVNGDFMLAMECLTIFENMDIVLSEEKVMPALVTINQYLNDNRGETSPKHSLLSEVAVFLNQINQSL